MNIAFNILTGGERIEHFELRRNDEVYLNALGAERIPHPTTAGDFCRRFLVADGFQGDTEEKLLAWLHQLLLNNS